MTTTATAPAPFTVTDVYLGRTADGARVYVDFRLEVARGGQMDIDHGTPAEPVYVFGIHGAAIDKGQREASNVGQIIDVVAGVRARHRIGGDPRPSFTDGDLARLVTIWRRWHLNDMRAGCRHQVVVTDTLDGTIAAPHIGDACPITGYRYGHAWLVEPMPADVVADIVRFGRIAGSGR